MCKKAVLLGLLLLALPWVAYASGIDISNADGMVSGDASGLTLTGSTLFKYGHVVGSNLGTVTFTTGAFTSGDPVMGGTLAPGGSFIIYQVTNELRQHAKIFDQAESEYFLQNIPPMFITVFERGNGRNGETPVAAETSAFRK